MSISVTIEANAEEESVVVAASSEQLYGRARDASVGTFGDRGGAFSSEFDFWSENRFIVIAWLRIGHKRRMAMPDETQSIDAVTLTAKDWRIFYWCDILGLSKVAVAERLGCHRKTVTRRLQKVRKLVSKPDFVGQIRQALLPLAEKAIGKVEEKIDEGDVNVLNAFLKGLGVYVTHEKTRHSVDIRFIPDDPNERLRRAKSIVEKQRRLQLRN